MNKTLVYLSLLSLVFVPLAAAQNSSTASASNQPVLPYTPSLDLTSMDKSIDPCVDLYHYSCGEWQKKNPIPPDQTSWSVYGKLYQDNLNFLRAILEQAALGGNRHDAVTREIGDFYAACMDEAGAEKRGLSAVQPDLDRVARLKSTKEMAPLVAPLSAYARRVHPLRGRLNPGPGQLRAGDRGTRSGWTRPSRPGLLHQR